MITIGELVSQIRNQSKSVNQDNLYISDRLIYSLIKKHLALFIYREDSKLAIIQIKHIYSVLPCVELKEVDKIEANCLGLKSGCTIKRTKEKLPPSIKGFTYPLIGNVTSIDGEISFTQTTSTQYVKKANLSDFRYNKTHYYWYSNGYLYFPDIIWDAVRIEIVLDAISINDNGEIDVCKKAQDIELGIPDYLISTVQAEVLKDVSFLIQAPKDNIIDKQSIT